MLGKTPVLTVAILMVSCTGPSQEYWDVWPDTVVDTADLDVVDMDVGDTWDVIDVDAMDVGWDSEDTGGSDLMPDYPDVWDVRELDITDEILDLYGHVYVPTDSFPIVIPDRLPTGVSSTVDVTDTGTVSAVAVYLAVRHPSRGDLRISINSPEGTRARLVNHSGASEDDILTFYPDLTAPADDFSTFVGESATGTWTLIASDDYENNVGQIEDWALYLDF